MADAMQMVAELMALSARTAPKAMGQDNVNIRVVSGEDIKELADEMARFGQESKKNHFDRDAESVRRSAAVLLVSLKENKPLGLNCGACGQSNCSDLQEKEGPEFAGPLCAWRLFDVGIALGSAVKTASMLNADNRIMYRVGIAARRLGMIDGPIAVGVPVSAYSKNIYYDRPENNK
jgi:uncharacterized ferredoxin-like protein